ncbi:hypothetical protein CY34DRAFT_808593 [Suillus luteus UH-Slu-Lm8-n1]|uniref:Uncharacterized protein n=1 Tax=Suillus luteus UH-Slu-Lm8-n1 TaxID=930992 RepID=A0A0C9ZNE2_9AGAM|nr:hypothetical protein CY34DRAFT_808593 [Suillus luteus UH-Slu-Lm8-n1]
MRLTQISRIFTFCKKVSHLPVLSLSTNPMTYLPLAELLVVSDEGCGFNHVPQLNRLIKQLR